MLPREPGGASPDTIIAQRAFSHLDPAFERTLKPEVSIPEDRHPVFDLIGKRIAEGSTPGNRADPYVLALAIEGGGMRGVISAGMTLALESLGTRLAFDRIYGSSAGSLMGAYFITGQSALAPSIYYQDLSTRRFISRRRFLSSRPVLDLDYLIDSVIVSLKPLDYEAVLAAPIDLHVLTTSIEDGTTVDLSGFRGKDELADAMRASARLPGLAGPPVTINGLRCYDAGLTESLGFRSAIQGGATHVLSLKTRVDGGTPVPLSKGQEWAMRRLLRVEPEAVKLISARPALYAAEGEELVDLASRGADSSPQVFAIGPSPDDPTIGRLGRTREELEVGAKVGINTVYRALGYGSPRLYEVLRPYWHPPISD
jgi:predicted patatin/cPLA2 family phospholipase